MKSLAALVSALSLSLSMAGTVIAETEEGAKGLFFQQLDHPADSLNTGIQYWIELHHDGKTIHATNKTAFHTGDKIRFHVRPNIDGYAYIMLKSGSRGEQAVLFPDKDRNEDNKITRGKEIVLPNDGMLGFDENPGVEKLTLLVSRKPIDTDAYMSGQEGPPRMVAMTSTGAKDLIPTQVYVAYLPPAATGAPDAVKKAATKSNTAIVSSIESKKSDTKKTEAKKPDVKKADAKKNVKTASTTAPTVGSPATTTASAHGKGEHKGHQTVAAKSKDMHDVAVTTEEPARKLASGETSGKPGLVTVVYKDPNGVLAAELSLEHLKD